MNCLECGKKLRSTCIIGYCKIHQALSPRRKATTIAWDKANPERKKANNAAWVKANPGKHRARSAKRNAAKLQRTPKWSDLKAIQQFYINCPKGYEVDHIVPLQGKNVSGLHVPWNLQYLTKSENCSKGNR
jgi:hypothetical protein